MSNVRRPSHVKKLLIAVSVAALATLVYADWPPARLSGNVRADRLVVDKRARLLTLYRAGSPLKSFAVSLGAEATGPKTREGDNRTPEGVYTIDHHKPDSSFHLALHISYPDSRDRARATAEGVAPGGDIMIHGLPRAIGWIGRLHRLHDWTAGCVAVTNPEIEQIYQAVPDGTAVEIRP
jgi:murein L,D-transpeptidase YafK